jgi:PAS domain S-box-containing protein
MIKILFVDDKSENSYLPESLLVESGFKTIFAKNGAEALDIALKNKPAIIISDILMPVMDGLTFCRECKKNKSLKNIPFAFYTATYTSGKEKEFALSIGADRVIQKPQAPDVFISIINEILNDSKKGNIRPFIDAAIPEEVILKEYNSVLIRNLEDKMAQAEETEKQLRKTNTELQNEIKRHQMTEDALRISEEKFRISFEDASVGMALTALDGRLILINDALSLMLGYSSKELLNRRITDFTHTDDVKPSLIWLSKMISGEMRVHRFNSRFMHKNGDVVYADMNTALIKDTFGIPLFFVTHIVNVTDQKLAEELLTISGTRYRRLFETAKDGIIILDAELGIILDINPCLMEMFGCQYEKTIGKAAWDISFLKDITADKDKFFELQKREYVHFDNLLVETLFGTMINIEFVCNTYKVNHDKVIQFNIRDITERKRMEKEVMESEDRFRMVFENVFDGICIYVEDPDPYKRKLVECNERYAVMAGRSREELLSREHTQDLQKTLEDKANYNRLESLAKEVSYKGSFSWIRPDGRENYIEYVGRPVTWRGKSYSIGIDRDITERKIAENELHKLSRAFEQSPVSIIITDRNGNIEYINRKVTETTGYEPADVAGKNIQLFSPGETLATEYKALWDTVVSGKVWRSELTSKKKNGELYRESASISPVFNEQRVITHFIAIKENRP